MMSVGEKLAVWERILDKFIEVRDFDQAKRLLDECDKKAPGDSSLLELRARLHFAQGDLPQAILCLVQSEGSSGETDYKYINSYFIHGSCYSVIAAEEEVDKIIEKGLERAKAVDSAEWKDKFEKLKKEVAAIRKEQGAKDARIQEELRAERERNAAALIEQERLAQKQEVHDKNRSSFRGTKNWL